MLDTTKGGLKAEMVKLGEGLSGRVWNRHGWQVYTAESKDNDTRKRAGGSVVSV